MKDYLKNIAFHFKHLFKFTPFLAVTYILLVIAVTITPFFISKIQASAIDSVITVLKEGKVTGDLVSFFGQPAPKALLILILMYGGVRLFQGILYSFRSLISYVSSTKYQMYFEFLILNKFLSLDMGRYEDPKFKLLVEKAVDAGNQMALQRLSNTFYKEILPGILTFGIASVIIAKYNPWILLILILIQIPFAIIAYFFDRRSYNIWDWNGGQDQRRYYMLRNQVRNNKGRNEIKLYQAERYFLRRIKEMYDMFFGKVQANERKKLWFAFLDDAFKAIGYSLAFVLLVKGALSGVITVGYVTFLLASMSSAYSSIQNILAYTTDSIQTSRFATHTREFLATKPTLVTPHTKQFGHLQDYLEDGILKEGAAPIIPQFDPEKGLEIRFEHVSFRYPNASKEDDRFIFKDLNLTLKAGEKIGLIGENGVGKSTLIKLICRIYDPAEGAIYVNGVNIRFIPPEIWQRQISVLMQSYSKYEFKVREAISISQNPEFPDDERVLQSAEKSRAMKFISQYEHGLDAQIGVDFDGVEPSGGQNQKLALARTLYRIAPIVILDEPTAAIDAESEIEIFEELENLPDNVTTIFISHDMGTIMRADRIVLLGNGGVAEDGTHEELMQKENGRYRTMYEKQLDAMASKKDDKDASEANDASDTNEAMPIAA